MWRVEAVWRETVTTNWRHAAHGAGTSCDFGDVQEFADLDDAKRHRAEILQRHPNATVSLEPAGHGRPTAPPPGRAPEPENVALALKRARAALERRPR